jgi:NAD(P)-dependent dehydrogenase (short-subunit alcohol dehydrogenase family)
MIRNKPGVGRQRADERVHAEGRLSMRCGGTVALVTGGQQGIGRAIALALAREGADVVLNYLDDPDAAARIAKEISAAGRRCLPVQGDVSRASDVAALVDAAERGVGPIDTLINNAGTFPRSAFLDLTEAEWDRVHGVNLKGSFLAAQAVARRLVARGSPGAIINLASSAAYRSSPRGTHYVASKAGVVGLTRAMALELAPHAIRVNAIAPGLTDTAQPRDGHSEIELQAMARQVPLGRMGQPDDIAAVAVFLASADARHITGQVIHVNGGAYLG